MAESQPAAKRILLSPRSPARTGLAPGAWVLLAACLAGTAASLAAPDVGREAGEVLSRRCIGCHGPQKRSGGVDLSTRAGAAAAGAAGPDDPARNRLVRMVSQGRMPPSGRLPEEELAVLRRWVRAGIPYPAEPLRPFAAPAAPLWSLQPIRKAEPPRTPWDALARGSIDRFVFRKLAEAGLRPSPPASRRELIRRVTIDLTGLPPAPEEVEAFLADRSPDAYAKVVDRLLASPAYGERWGQHWLDVVRYGESHGYEQNHLRPNAWPYRDYVIRALNEDRPFDRFLQEQLAGDVLGPGDPAVETGTGFLVAGVHDTVGNQTVEGQRLQRAADLDDMVSTTAEAFLGLTAGCARCHDHKFDPIPQRDYYRLAAVFAGVRHGERPFSLSAEGAAPRADQWETAREIRRTAGEIADLDAAARIAVLSGQGLQPVPRPAVSPRRNLESFPPLPARFVRILITATRDGTQPCLDELEVYGPEGEENLARLPGARAAASSLLPGYAIHQVAHLNDGRYGNDWSWISSEPGAGWASIELPREARVDRVVWSRDGEDRPRYTDRVPSAYRIQVSLDGRDWRDAASSQDRSPAPEAIPGPLLAEALTPAQRARRAELSARLEELRRRAAPALKMAYLGQFTAPEPIHLLVRGDVMQRGEEVPAGALSCLPGLPGELTGEGGRQLSGPERRLALARWLTDARNPLTPRVIANRVWHYHFGRGIVGTPSDFGRNGEKPSHPDLLDWLAAAFSRPAPAGSEPPGAHAGSGLGWSLKKLHRLICTSYTYCQASAADPRGMARDAGNRLLWRMPLRRMEAEAVRDAVLFTSGRLDRRMGGPGFQLFRYRVVNVAIYEALEEHAPGTWRRSVYRQPARGIRDELLGTLDCPESAQRTPRRESTTTALQALSLLNGAFTLQQAGFFAERVRAQAGEQPADQVRQAFQLAFGRPPAAAEATAALELVTRHGLATLCRGLLNANEFLYY